MQEPITAGDLCIVIGGLQGDQSPNLNLIVEVDSYQGEHSVHGPIWRCKAEFAENAKNGINVPAGYSDFARSWLKKIPKNKAKDTSISDKVDLKAPVLCA